MKNYTNTDLKRIEAEISLLKDNNYYYKNKKKKIVSAIFENLLVLLKAICVIACIVAFAMITHIIFETFGLDEIVIIDSIVALFKWIFTALKTLALISVYIIVILIAVDMIFTIIKKIFKRN
ncbi:hypothetical protein [Vagococcus lutrae]|uniref:hypothetical protein n=1 Tax=Vagococcus lutrae TaxID=81947 RepID=UPI0028922232|nr:hypothetical protein [Vagococcus lutrae]MDT2844782.1 hypothetical protein [Vagococcus lutrae]